MNLERCNFCKTWLTRLILIPVCKVAFKTIINPILYITLRGDLLVQRVLSGYCFAIFQRNVQSVQILVKHVHVNFEMN